MSTYRLTPQAHAGLAGILADVEARFGTIMAIEVFDRISRALELIAVSPGLGHRREDITPLRHVYFCHVGPTLIPYQRNAYHVEVLFIERGERDWTAFAD